MDTKLSQKLISCFPLLYSECNNASGSLMDFGFEIQDGWFELIWQLSLMLEPIIHRHVKAERKPSCAKCACPKNKHYGHLTKKPGRCLSIHIDPNSKEDPPGNYWSCFCENYQSSHPRAAQIKEKYGGLRFYMTDMDDEMLDIVTKAEQLSFYICKKCGEPLSLPNDLCNCN